MLALPLTDLPAVAQDYNTEAMLRLVVICRELQRARGEGPFYLSCRKAGQLIGVDHDTASRWLRVLVVDGILVPAWKGRPGNPRAAQLASSAALYAAVPSRRMELRCTRRKPAPSAGLPLRTL